MEYLRGIFRERRERERKKERLRKKPQRVIKATHTSKCWFKAILRQTTTTTTAITTTTKATKRSSSSFLSTQPRFQRSKKIFFKV